MKRTIPIRRPSPHFDFDLDLRGQRIRVRLDWLTRWEFYLATITCLEDDEILVAGIGLHPDVDLLVYTGTDCGKLYLSGDPATPDNLGIANELVWETED